MHPALALVTLGTIALLFVATALVGRARGKFGVKAPATTGHEGFERVFRAQANTVEQTVAFLPALWLAGTLSRPDVAAAIGAAWLVGRTWYLLAYANPGGDRGWGFLIGLLALAALFLQAGWGLVARWLLA